MQSLLITAETFSAPWRERMPDGTLGEQYGPSSPVAHARKLAVFKQWAFRPGEKPRAKPVIPEETATALVALVASGRDIPKRERDVFELVVVKGHAVRFVARQLGMRRQSVKSFLARLIGRLGG
jgi:DNA-directed RNA polymerase specialized sigma24 family protein